MKTKITLLIGIISLLGVNLAFSQSQYNNITIDNDSAPQVLYVFGGTRYSLTYQPNIKDKVEDFFWKDSGRITFGYTFKLITPRKDTTIVYNMRRWTSFRRDSSKIVKTIIAIIVDTTKKTIKKSINVPTLLNYLNYAPTNGLGLQASTSDNKISLKAGGQISKQVVKRDSNQKGTKSLGNDLWYFSSGVSFQAINGITTLYKTNNPPISLDLTPGFYWMPKNLNNTWFSIAGEIKQNTYNLYSLIDNDSLSKTNSIVWEGQGFLSVARQDTLSLLGKKMPFFWTLGAGGIKTDNYSTLKQINVQNSVLVNTVGTSVESMIIQPTTSGAIGNLIQDYGPAFYFQLYIRVFPNVMKSGYSLYVGENNTVYNLHITQITTFNDIYGIYFIPTKGKGSSFALTYQSNQTNYLSNTIKAANNSNVTYQINITASIDIAGL